MNQSAIVRKLVFLAIAIVLVGALLFFAFRGTVSSLEMRFHFQANEERFNEFNSKMFELGKKGLLIMDEEYFDTRRRIHLEIDQSDLAARREEMKSLGVDSVYVHGDNSMEYSTFDSEGYSLDYFYTENGVAQREGCSGDGQGASFSKIDENWYVRVDRGCHVE